MFVYCKLTFNVFNIKRSYFMLYWFTFRRTEVNLLLFTQQYNFLINSCPFSFMLQFSIVFVFLWYNTKCYRYIFYNWPLRAAMVNVDVIRNHFVTLCLYIIYLVNIYNTLDSSAFMHMHFFLIACMHIRINPQLDLNSQS